MALLRARERVMQPVRPMLAAVGVTEAQWRVLRVLNEIGPTDATRIAAEACLLMPSLTRILHGLEDRGLTERKPHPTDGRKALVSVTEEGAVLMSKCADGAREIDNDLRARFGDRQVDDLLDLLNELSVIEL